MRTGMFWGLIVIAASGGCKNCRDGSCHSSSSGATPMTAMAANHGGQTHCPVTGAPLPADAIPVLANGRTVYVCCANCAAKVKANPDAFAPKAAAGLPSALPPAPQAAAAALPFGGQKLCPVTGEELTSGAIAVNTRGQKVYVCCPGCAMKVKLNPDKYLPAVMEDRAKNGVQ